MKRPCRLAGCGRHLNPADLVFVDETSTHTALTRRRARAPRGERAVGRTPRNHGPNVTLLASLTPEGIGPQLAIPERWMGRPSSPTPSSVLAPSLRPGQVVVLDNLSAHKRERARTAVEAAGARLLFLPPYSPDFNPIELAFAKVKERLRAAAAARPTACSPPPRPPSTPSPPPMSTASTPTVASRSRPLICDRSRPREVREVQTRTSTDR